MTTIRLGDLCRDTVTGFEGIATARSDYISGCSRLTLQPSVGADGKIPEPGHFDEPMLTVVRAAAVAGISTTAGGPQPAPTHRAPVPR